MERINILITGGRDYKGDGLKRALDWLRLNLSGNTRLYIHHGGCSGADSIAEEWAKSNNIHSTAYLAEWEQHGRAAGPIRNDTMVKTVSKLENVLVLAVRGGEGTRDCVDKSRKSGLTIFQVVG